MRALIGIIFVAFIGFVTLVAFVECRKDLSEVKANLQSIQNAEIARNLSELQAEMDRREAALVQAAAVIGCESGGRHDGVWGDGGRSYGIAQMQRRTFYALAQEAGFYGADWKNRNDQINLLIWAIENDRADEWTCWKKLFGKTKTMGGRDHAAKGYSSPSTD